MAINTLSICNLYCIVLFLGDEILSVNGSILQGKSHGRILITSSI